MAERLVHSFVTALDMSAGLAAAGTSVVVAELGPDWATGGDFRVVIESEILKVTAVNEGTRTLTVVRGQEGTTAVNYSPGVAVVSVLTPGGLNAWLSASGGGVDALSELSDVALAGTADGDVLLYDAAGGRWINFPLGSVGGSLPLGSLSDVHITSPALGDLLVKRSGGWVNEARNFVEDGVLVTDEVGVGPYTVQKLVFTTGAVALDGSDPDKVHIDVTQLGAGGSAWSYKGVKVHKTATQSVSNGPSDVAVTFDAEDWDTDGFHDNASNNSRLTVPAGLSGKIFRVWGNIGLTGWTGSGSIVRARIIKNGSTVLAECGAGEQGGVDTGLCPHWTGVLSSGDYVELAVRCGTGSTQVLRFNSGNIPAFGLDCLNP